MKTSGYCDLHGAPVNGVPCKHCAESLDRIRTRKSPLTSTDELLETRLLTRALRSVRKTMKHVIADS